MLRNSRPTTHTLRLAFVALLLLTAATTPRAQSSDANFPTPIFTSEINGRIAPRDVGDPRRTRHFYAFRGTEGDLVVSLETAQLIGDVDVFTSPGFRPLLKFTLFGDPAQLSKSFYLRKDEALVLRVEARAVGDAEGTYTVRFGGAFAPAPPEMANATEPAAPTLSASEPRGRNTRRVTSTGARIEEPRPEPTPVEEAREEARPAATPTPESPAGRRSTAASRRGRGTRTPPSRSRAGTAPARPETAETKPAEDSSTAAATPTETPATPAPSPTSTPRRRPTRPARRGSTRGSAGRGESASQPPPAAPLAQRLIIVTREGETFEFDMSAVRRVTVENNQVVIVTIDGKVTRRPLASVLKMSIEP
jgi:hypothetical protein